jgi:DNA-binding transcriptional ArsR family regulator
VEPGHGSKIRLDARNLRGIAHPVRMRMLGLLRVEGPATATMLARRLGLNTGATSYHLRQLAVHGFVVEDHARGTARERWWRSAHRVTTWDRAGLSDDDSGLGSMFLRSAVEVLADSMSRAVDELPTLPVAWRDAGTFDDYLLQLTPDELRTLVGEITDLVRRYRQADPEAPVPAPDGTATVKLQLQAFPYPGTLEPAPDDSPGGDR